MERELKSLLEKFKESSELLFINPLEQIARENNFAGYIVATCILVQLERIGYVVNPEGNEDSSGKFSEGRFKRGFEFVFKRTITDAARLHDAADLVWKSGRCGLAHVARLNKGVWIHNHSYHDPLTVSANDAEIEVHINLIKAISEIRSSYERLIRGEGINAENSVKQRIEVLKELTSYSTKVLAVSIESGARVSSPKVVISGASD